MSRILKTAAALLGAAAAAEAAGSAYLYRRTIDERAQGMDDAAAP